MKKKATKINRLKSDLRNIQDQFKTKKTKQLFEHGTKQNLKIKKIPCTKSTATVQPPTFASAKFDTNNAVLRLFMNNWENIKQDILQLRLNTLARPQ